MKNFKKKLALLLALAMVLPLLPSMGVQARISNANRVGTRHVIPAGRSIVVANPATRAFWVHFDTSEGGRGYLRTHSNNVPSDVRGHSGANIDGSLFHNQLHLQAGQFGTPGQLTYHVAQLRLTPQGGDRIPRGSTAWLPDASLFLSEHNMSALVNNPRIGDNRAAYGFPFAGATTPYPGSPATTRYISPNTPLVFEDVATGSGNVGVYIPRVPRPLPASPSPRPLTPEHSFFVASASDVPALHGALFVFPGAVMYQRVFVPFDEAEPTVGFYEYVLNDQNQRIRVVDRVEEGVTYYRVQRGTGGIIGRIVTQADIDDDRVPNDVLVGTVLPVLADGSFDVRRDFTTHQVIAVNRVQSWDTEVVPATTPRPAGAAPVVPARDHNALGQQGAARNLMARLNENEGTVGLPFNAFNPVIRGSMNVYDRYYAELLYFARVGTATTGFMTVALIRHNRDASYANLVIEIDARNAHGLLSSELLMPINYVTHYNALDVRDINLEIANNRLNFGGASNIQLATRVRAGQTPPPIGLPARAFTSSIASVARIPRFQTFFTIDGLAINEAAAGAFDIRHRIGNNLATGDAAGSGRWTVQLALPAGGAFAFQPGMAPTVDLRQGGEHGMQGSVNVVSNTTDFTNNNRTMTFDIEFDEVASTHDVTRLMDSVLVNGLTIVATNAAPQSNVNVTVSLRPPSHAGQLPWVGAGTTTIAQFDMPNTSSIALAETATQLVAGRAGWILQGTGGGIAFSGTTVYLPGDVGSRERTQHLTAGIRIQEAGHGVLNFDRATGVVPTAPTALSFTVPTGVHLLGVRISSNAAIQGGNDVVFWNNGDDTQENPYNVRFELNNMTVHVNPDRTIGVTTPAEITVRFYVSVQSGFAGLHGGNNALTVMTMGSAFFNPQGVSATVPVTHTVATVVEPFTLTSTPVQQALDSPFMFQTLNPVRIAENQGSTEIGESLQFTLELNARMPGFIGTLDTPPMTLNVPVGSVVGSGGFNVHDFRFVGNTLTVSVTRVNNTPGVITINNAQVSGLIHPIPSLQYTFELRGDAVARNTAPLVGGTVTTGTGLHQVIGVGLIADVVTLVPPGMIGQQTPTPTQTPPNGQQATPTPAPTPTPRGVAETFGPARTGYAMRDEATGLATGERIENVFAFDNGTALVAARAVQNLLGLSFGWDGATLSFTVYDDYNTVTFSYGSPFVIVNDGYVIMEASASLSDEFRLMVPASVWEELPFGARVRVVGQNVLIQG